MKKFTSQSLTDTSTIAQEILSYATTSPRQEGATVLALTGDLGAGKTAFTKLFAEHLGITETLVSPTFVIAKFYEIKKEAFPWKRLVHIDAYRLESWEELRTLKFDEVFQDPQNIIVIEWPEQVSDVDQTSWQHITFELGSEDRVITLK